MWFAWVILWTLVGLATQTTAFPESRASDETSTGDHIILNITKFSEIPRGNGTGADENNTYDGQAATSSMDSRIIGGSNAEAGEWPWQTMIWKFDYAYRQYRFVCGGSLISDKWVISAAHCFDTSVASLYKVTLGALFLARSGSNWIDITPQAILCHEDFNDDTNENDICLIQLPSEVEYTNYILPIRLPSTEDITAAGESCIITGWGATNGAVPANPSRLQEADVQVFSKSVCKAWYAEDDVSVLEEVHMCAGTTDGSKTACYGDSGGPLACSRDVGSETVFTLFGLTSFGITGCSARNRPTVFTDVTKFLDWITITQELNTDEERCFDEATIYPCGSTITTNNTIIRSPASDYTTWHYPNNMDCAWEIRAPAQNRVKLEHICLFAVEGSGLCSQDHLEITDSHSDGTKYCGSQSVKSMNAFTTEGNNATLTFHSDGAETNRGFVLLVTFLPTNVVNTSFNTPDDETNPSLNDSGNSNTLESPTNSGNTTTFASNETTTPSSPSAGSDVWKTVGIVFICLFIVALLVAGVACFWCCREED